MIKKHFCKLRLDLISNNSNTYGYIGFCQLKYWRFDGRNHTIEVIQLTTDALDEDVLLTILSNSEGLDASGK